MMLPLLQLWGLRLFLRENRDDQLQSVKKLRSKYSHISNGLIRTKEIVAELFQATVLTARERDDIQIFLSTPVRANEQLLNSLIFKDSRAFECFLTALSNTDQKHIAEILIHEDEYLDTKHPLVIQRNYATLIDNLDVHSGLLLDRLYEASLLTGREMATINAKPTKHEKNETLLALVSKFSVTNFDTFLQALEKSNQEHVVSILTGKDLVSLVRVGSASHESILEVQQTTQERKSFKALQTTFIKLPDELQTELSLKVAALRQKTTLPSDANMDIFYHKIVRGFIQQRKSLNRQLIEFEDLRKILGRVNEPTENFASQLEGQLKANISVLNEELGWHRNNKRHLDETLQTTATELDESRRRVDALARQLEQWQKENNDLRTERDGTVSELEKILEQEREVWAEEKDRIRNQIQELQNGLSGSSKKCSNLEQELKLQRTENDRLKEQAQEYNSISDADGTVSELEKMLEQERKVWAEEKERVRNKIQELQNELSGSSKKCFNLEQELELQRTENDRLKEQTQEYNRIIDAGREEMQVIEQKLEQEKKEKEELTNQLEDERGAKNQLINQFQDQRRLFDSTVSELKEKLEQERKVWAEEKKQLVNQMQELQKEFSDCRTKIVDLEQERGRERNAWIVEKEQLINQIKEMHRSIGKLRFNLDPVLVQTIRTKADEVKNKWIRGMTILDEKLFVVKRSEVEVYDSMKFNFSRRWNLKELIGPKDIGSCNRNKCLYIFDYKGPGRSSEILRVDPNGNLIKSWSTGDDWGRSLSVTDEWNVILTVCDKNKLNEYSSDGQLIREIILSDARRPILHPWHAIKLTSGHVVVSHGGYDDDLHRVCIVDGDGKLKKSFGGKRGSTNGQMNLPVQLAVDGNGFVMVVDSQNSRVLLLDSNLEFKREIRSEEKNGLRFPSRILLDQKSNRLLVADKEFCSENEIHKDGRILIFEFR